MSRRLLAGVMAAALATTAQAAPAPTPAARDPRLRWVDYAPGVVVKVMGASRTATQLVFGEAETIRHVALGDPAAWEVAAEDGVLFLRPKTAGPPTNLIVTTRTSQGASRHYHFELIASRKTGDRQAPDFAIGFRHPADEAARVATALTAQTQALERKVVQLQLERGAIEGPRNLDYELVGDMSLAPSETSDNGRFTVLRFPAGRPLPAVYLLASDGAETLARFDVRGEFVVVHQTAAALRLRSGRRILCILNRAFDADGRSSGTLTASPDVERSLANKP